MKEMGFACIYFAPLSWNHKQFHPLIFQKDFTSLTEGVHFNLQRLCSFQLGHRACNMYSMCISYYGLPLKTDPSHLPLYLSILILKITGTLTIISHARKVVKRLMFWEELIQDLEALCYRRSLSLHYTMTAGQGAGVGVALIIHTRVLHTSVGALLTSPQLDWIILIGLLSCHMQALPHPWPSLSLFHHINKVIHLLKEEEHWGQDWA